MDIFERYFINGDIDGRILSTSGNNNTGDPLIIGLFVTGVLFALFLVMMLYYFLLYPRLMGVMVIALSNARNGVRVSIEDVVSATGGRRYTQLIVVSLCSLLTIGALSAVSVIAYLIIALILTSASHMVISVSGMIPPLRYVIQFFPLILAVILLSIPFVLSLFIYQTAIYEDKYDFHAAMASIRYGLKVLPRLWVCYLPIFILNLLLVVLNAAIVVFLASAQLDLVTVLWTPVPVVASSLIFIISVACATAFYIRIREDRGDGISPRQGHGEGSDARL